MAPYKSLSCGVLVTDGTHLLIGHATRTPRWDIPKGMADPGEVAIDAAVRELREETGLVAAPADLAPLGVHAYLRDKDLALFGWRLAAMPDPARLICTSFVPVSDGTPFPELDDFAVLPWDDALARLNANLARVLATLRGATGVGS